MPKLPQRLPRIARPLRLALAPLLLLACSLGCQVKEKSPDFAQLAEDLTFHRQLWDGREIASYVCRFQQTCSCPPELTAAVRMQVEDNVAVSLTDHATGTPVDSTLWVYFPTINQLFNIIGVEIESRADDLEVAYHPELGYPTSIAIDQPGGGSGDDISYAVEVESYTSEGAPAPGGPPAPARAHTAPPGES